MPHIMNRKFYQKQKLTVFAQISKFYESYEVEVQGWDRAEVNGNAQCIVF